MEHFKNLLDFINELNESGRIQYDDYSRLFDLAEAFSEMEQELDAAKTDIAALLWLNGDCQYCAHGEKEEFSGANRWHCRLGSGVDCRAVWRGTGAGHGRAPKGRTDFCSCKSAYPRGAYVRSKRNLEYSRSAAGRGAGRRAEAVQGLSSHSLRQMWETARLLCKGAYRPVPVQGLRWLYPAARPHIVATPL